MSAYCHRLYEFYCWTNSDDFQYLEHISSHGRLSYVIFDGRVFHGFCQTREGHFPLEYRKVHYKIRTIGTNHYNDYNPKQPDHDAWLPWAGKAESSLMEKQYIFRLWFTVWFKLLQYCIQNVVLVFVYLFIYLNLHMIHWEHLQPVLTTLRFTAMWIYWQNAGYLDST